MPSLSFRDVSNLGNRGRVTQFQEEKRDKLSWTLQTILNLQRNDPSRKLFVQIAEGMPKVA